mgnify:CR=1 FL=1
MPKNSEVPSLQSSYDHLVVFQHYIQGIIAVKVSAYSENAPTEDAHDTLAMSAEQIEEFLQILKDLKTLLLNTGRISLLIDLGQIQSILRPTEVVKSLTVEYLLQEEPVYIQLPLRLAALVATLEKML